ncbi:N-acetylglucosaminylphosphatidylinositoldeacety la se [Lenzites betulinus]|nr:N-acetylglucosaminylphosphatidylinositoldeacety la se [Lenzites betulinus]
MIQAARFWLSTLLLSVVCGFLSQPAQKDLAVLTEVSATNGAPHILLLTAHPDDECMFFAPTLLALLGTAAHDNEPKLYSLCLSVGNADGLGDVRRHELERSLDILGVENGRRWVVDRPDLQDNFTAEWDPKTVSDVLRSYVLENHISTILTFDHQGISSHPNHISLPKGAARLLSTLSDDPAAKRLAPRVFSLITVPLYAKYLGPVAPIVAKVSVTLGSRSANPDAMVGTTPVAISSWAGYARALQAMMQHRSQLVWFRWLYVSFSRYMWVNKWVEVRASGATLRDAETVS